MSDNLIDIEGDLTTMGRSARDAFAELAGSSSAQRDRAIRNIASQLRDNTAAILAANQRDMQIAEDREAGSAMLDRLRLDESRIDAMAAGIEAICELPDPLGRVIAEWQRPNGLRIQRVTVPLGVIGIIYESRPNVTADAAALCLKSGNAVILRGGSESFRSSHAIYDCIRDGLVAAGLNPDCVQMIATRDRAAVGFLLSGMSEWLDVVVPRGGKSLIRRVQEEARVPVIGHLDGICHVYLHASADMETAVRIAVNAKMRRTGICGAAETLLVDAACHEGLLEQLGQALQQAGCEIRADERVVARLPFAMAATPEDWETEYLDAIVAIRMVDDIDTAIEHIATYGSGHTDCIVASDASAAEHFLTAVDSAIVLHNASTQFADGGEFGMGAEIGIATGRIHARGPVGAEQLTSYKYVVRGDGQVRPA